MNTQVNNLTPDRVAGYRAAQRDIANFGHDLATAMFFGGVHEHCLTTEETEGYKAALADHIAQLDDDDEPYWPDHDHAEDR